MSQQKPPLVRLIETEHGGTENMFLSRIDNRIWAVV
jgi:hypothetical protein